MTPSIRSFILLCSVFVILSACGGGGSNGGAANSSPTAVISVTKTSGYAPLSVEFNALQSSDRDGSITDYSWDFGDGATSLGSQVNHTYTGLGVFSATLTVTDNDGSTSSAFVTINSHAQIAGYYFGHLSSNVTGIVTDIEVIIGTNHEAHAWDYVNFDSGYWGDLDITESVVSGTISAQVWNPALVFPDGSQFGAISITGDVVPRQSIDGVYSGIGDTGTLGVQYVTEISNQPYSLADVSGIWTYSDGAGFSDSITISETGALDYSASDGCTAQGQLSVLDPLLNGFTFSYDMTCPAGVNPIPNGVRSGIAYVDDFFFVDTWIVMAGSIGNEGTLLSWSRPSAVSGGGLFQAAAKSESDTSLARGERARR